MVIEDRGTALKVYLARLNVPNVEAQADAQREAAVLEWLHKHNETGIATPYMHHLRLFSEPIGFRLGEEPLAAVASVRMSIMGGKKPKLPIPTDQPPSRDEIDFYRQLGEITGRFNALFARAPLPECDQLETDALVHSLRRTASKGGTDFIARADLHMMLADYKALTAALPLQLQHGDLHAGNVRVNEKGKIIGVLDWGSATLGFSGRDLVHHAHVSPLKGYQQINQIVQDAYTQATGQKPDSLLLQLYGLMHRARYMVGYKIGTPPTDSFMNFMRGPYDLTLDAYKQARLEHPLLRKRAEHPSGP